MSHEKKTKTLLSIAYIWMTSYISDQLNEQQRIGSFFQLLTDSHDLRVWFLGGYSISRVFFSFPACVMHPFSWRDQKRTAGILEEQKKQQPTNQKPNIFFFKNKHKNPPTRRKLLEVPTSRHPGNSLIWPHLMTVKLFFCLFCRGVVPSIRVY